MMGELDTAEFGGGLGMPGWGISAAECCQTIKCLKGAW